MTKTDYIKSLSIPERAAALRRVILARYAVAAKDVFKEYPKVNSVAFCVAQFWSDNADDEVHFRLCPSELQTPDLVALSAHQYHDNDPVNLPSGRLPLYGYGCCDPLDVYGIGPYISAFAAFCRETYQDAEFVDQYSAFAIFRRDKSMTTFTGETTISTEITGRPFRTWLDAVDNDDKEYECYKELVAEIAIDAQQSGAIDTASPAFDRLIHDIRAWAPAARSSEVFEVLNELQSILNARGEGKGEGE